jgi:hypothetical protein
MDHSEEHPIASSFLANMELSVGQITTPVPLTWEEENAQAFK